MWIQWIPIRIRIRIRKTAGDPKTYGSCGSESATLVVANTFTHLDSTGKGGREGGEGRGGDRPFLVFYASTKDLLCSAWLGEI